MGKSTNDLAIVGFVLAIINFFTFFLLAVPAIIFSLWGLYKIKKSEGRLKGKSLAWAGLIIAVLQLVIFALLSDRIFQKPAYRLICGTNLKGIGNAMMIYSNDYNDKYPTPDKWCDLLIEYADVSPKQLRCKAAQKGPSNYALNPKADATSSPSLVVAFECGPGWNQYGGPELLTAANHKGKGCNILFNDIHVSWVKSEEFDKLFWDPCDPNLQKYERNIEPYSSSECD